MAEYYCDHGAYGGTPVDPIPGNPTWGSAQEGDGSGPDPSTPATCYIYFTAVPTTGALSVCGVSLTMTTVFAAGSANAAADALATLINASTTAVGAGNVFNAHQLRNCVYARGPTNGAAAGCCEIMSRAGSASLNGVTAIAHTLNNVGTSQLTWTGGVGGCWGCAWSFRTATGIGDSITASQYGAFYASYLIGSFTGGDTVRFRTDRNVQLLIPDSANGISTIAKLGALTARPVRFLFDNGAAWTASNGYFQLGSVGYKSNTNGLLLTVASNVVFEGTTLPSDSNRRTLQIVGGTSNSSYPPLFQFHGSRIRWKRVEFLQSNTYAGRFNASGTTDAYKYPMEFIECSFVTTVNGGGHWYLTTNDDSDLTLRLKDCVIYWTGTQNNAATVTLLGSLGTRSNARDEIVVSGCKAVGAAAGLGHSFVPNTGAALQKIRLIDNDFGLINSFSPNLVGNFNPISNSSYQRTDKTFELTTLNNERFHVEDYQRRIYWTKDYSLPVLATAQTWNGDPFSLLMQVADTANYVTPWSPVPGVPFYKTNELGEGALSITLEFLIDQTIPTGNRTRETYWFEVTYVDTAGNIVTDSTFVDQGESIDGSGYVSTAAWDRTDCVIGGTTHYFDKRKLSLTTSQDVADESPVRLVFYIGTVHPTTSDPVIICPEFSMSL